MVFRALIVFLSLAIYIPVIGQLRNIKFEHKGIEDGLSHSHVVCILQDSRGFMWFGTRNGLNKYDGYSFTVYKNNIDDVNSLLTYSKMKMGIFGSPPLMEVWICSTGSRKNLRTTDTIQKIPQAFLLTIYIALRWISKATYGLEQPAADCVCWTEKQTNLSGMFTMEVICKAFPAIR